jgi:hypothetical protein
MTKTLDRWRAFIEEQGFAQESQPSHMSVNTWVPR